MPFVPFSYRAMVLRIDWKRLVAGLPLEARTHDGDSAWLLFDEGKYHYSCANCRFFGINTREMNEKDPTLRESAVKARDRLRGLIDGKEVFVRSEKLDKYGRPIVLIWLKEEDFGDPKKSVNYQMILENFTGPYMDDGVFSD